MEADEPAGDVSPDFVWTKADAEAIAKILPHEATPQAILVFAEVSGQLTDYAYWFMLSSLWVSYAGWCDLVEWRRLFSSPRPKRKTGIMKPSEVRAFDELADPLRVYRAHRRQEADWIAYTVSPLKAAEFARRRGVEVVSEYSVRKADALCLFLRRGEFEVLVLDKSKANFIRDVPVIATPFLGSVRPQ